MDFPAVELLNRWLGSAPGDEAVISTNLEVVSSPSLGRCITAEKPFEKNELLLKVPKRYLMNYTTVLNHISYHNKELALFLETKSAHFDNHNCFASADKFTSFYSKLDLDRLLNLTSHQLLSFYICLERKRGKDSFWYPLLSCFPHLNDYRSIPMTWNLETSTRVNTELFHLLPKSAINHARSQCTQFNCDMKTVNTLMEEQGMSFTKDEFLWAWLAINTRCLYYKLPHYIPITETKESEASNVTLVPFVDFINHLPENSNCLARETISGYEVVATRKIPSGSHLWFTYGPHDDEFLQCEYGFSTSRMTKNKPLSYASFNIYNTVDISPILIKLLDSIKRKNTLKWLEQNNYYNDYTLGIDDILKGPEKSIKILVRPSYRTRIALASLFENDKDFYYNESQHNIECPLRLKRFCEGLSDGECYYKSGKVLLDKIVSKLQNNFRHKLDTLGKLNAAGSVEYAAVEQLLMDQSFLLNSIN